LPVNRQVVLNMQSTDVIHSFFVPQFRMKQDILPGRITTYRVTPNLIGTYQVECAQLCGLKHSYMTAPVIVSSQADYDSWIQTQLAAAAVAAQTPLGRGHNWSPSMVVQVVIPLTVAALASLQLGRDFISRKSNFPVEPMSRPGQLQPRTRRI